MYTLKKLFLLLPVLICAYGTSFAQKFGYIDTEYVLSKMPEYQKAQAEIDQLAGAWQNEIKQMYVEIDEMYSKLKAEEVLLTKEMKEERLNEIKAKEQAAKEYQAKVFGAEGLYFLKKKELIKPVQEQVYEAVEKVAKEKRLQIVFDKSGDLVMIYTDPIHDYTDYVLEALGLGDKNDFIEQ